VSKVATGVGQGVMRSAAHRRHADLGATFERRGAWEVPVSYGSEDADALESGLAYADVSARGKIHLSGAVDGLVRQLSGVTLEPLQTGAMGAGGRVAHREEAAAKPPDAQ
jgi:glycine cleavage system aminomethyltransferase T